jgi:YesN/AraC family two-component response regulator
MVVREVLEKMDLDPVQVELGEAELKTEPSAGQVAELKSKLSALGFELLNDRKSTLVEKVKNIVIELIHQSDELDIQVNFSTILQDKLHVDYSYVSSLFSDTVGLTIEKYIIQQRIEKVKELLIYNELSLSEISYKLGYSSVQHLSTQFKKVTGLTPTHFKKIKENKRKSLDEI